MKKMVCEICGSNDIEKKDGLYVCKSCGTQYSTEEAKKLLVEISGNVEVSGSVKIDNSDRLENLYSNARRARNAANFEEAAKYYDYILVEDPNSWEANFYYIYSKAMSCKIAEIGAYATLVANSYSNVLRLIKSNLPENEWNKVVKETATLIDAMYRLLIKGSYDFHYHYSDMISIANDGFKCCDGAAECGDAIDTIFKDNQTVVKNAIIPWETCVFLCDGLIDLRPSKIDPYTLTNASRNSYRSMMNSYQNKIENCKDPDGSIRKRQAEQEKRRQEQQKIESEKRRKEHKESLTGTDLLKQFALSIGVILVSGALTYYGKCVISDDLGFFSTLFGLALLAIGGTFTLSGIVLLVNNFKDLSLFFEKEE